MRRREFIEKMAAGALALGLPRASLFTARRPTHIDARTLESGSLIEGDLCIIGAGPAGISLALEWVGTPVRVLLLEGGGFDYDPRLQDLYRGEVIGRPYDFPLEAVRLHYFGGTSGHWAGFCSPYDAIDFERRDWVPYSGWPISRTDLDPYYARAQALPELGPYDYDASYWQAQNPDMTPLPLDEDVVWTKMWQFSPPTRFGTRYRDAIVDASNVHLYTHANVTEVVANEPVSSVQELRVKTIEGKEHRVRAQYFVLAAGSIQNARLLLASNRQAPAGLGNDHDLVGRFFMEHFEMPGAQLILEKPQSMKMYEWNWGTTRARGELALGAEVQRAKRILNGTASMRPGVFGEDVLGTFQWMRQMQEQGLDLRSPDTRRLPPETEPALQRMFQLSTRQEQAPNPSSRVSLGAEKDSLGVPRVRLDWQLSEIDKRSIRTFYEILRREMERSGLGRVQPLDWLLDNDDTAWPSFLSGGWHHMGTTRMHSDPKQGVVDANARVHGLANLFVAGASVFPTAGAANPTLTLIAMTLRLSDYLKGKVG